MASKRLTAVLGSFMFALSGWGSARADVRVTDAPPSAGPVLSGTTRVLWAEPFGRRATNVMAAEVDGRRVTRAARRLYTVRPHLTRGRAGVRALAASEQAVAFHTAVTSFASSAHTSIRTHREQVVAGPYGGRLRVVASAYPRAGCRRRRFLLGEIAVWRSILVYTEVIAYCHGASPRYAERVRIRDLQTGRVRTLVTTADERAYGGGDVRIAGRYVAWVPSESDERGDQRVVLVDHRTARIVRTVTRATFPTFNGFVWGLDVEADGTLVFTDTDDQLFVIGRRGKGRRFTGIGASAVQIGASMIVAHVESQHRARLVALRPGSRPHLLVDLPPGVDHVFDWNGHALVWETSIPGRRGRGVFYRSLP